MAPRLRIRLAAPRSGALTACLASVAMASAMLAIQAPGAHAFAVSLWEAGTCEHTTCKYATVEQELKEKGHSDAVTQSAGHPQWGITTFEIKANGGGEPEGKLKRVRVDVPEGLAANPQAPPKQCKKEEFEKDACPAESEVGTTELTVYLLGAKKATGTVYSLEPPPGLPLYFGIRVNKVEGLEGLINEHVLLEGHVSWHKEKVLEERGVPSGDYHEWFEINNVAEKAPVVRSQLNFNGHAGGDFITLPTACSATTTSYVELESWEGQVATRVTHTPVGVAGCANDPFSPVAEVKPETSQSDLPDGAATVVKVKQNAGAGEINTADIKDARVTLPEGMTLDPSGAHGLETCSPAQIAIGSQAPVTCPAASKVGTVAIETPDLPPGSLKGNAYLGNPGGGAITGPPFTIYVDAKAEKYDVQVRLKGLVNPDPASGRLTATFTGNPQLPFSEFILKSTGGARAPLANPLACGITQTDALFTPYTELAAWQSSTPFTTIGCPSFSWTQSAVPAPSSAGSFGSTSYTFNLVRPDGQQYLSKIATTLPLGLVGAIPAVTLCGEPQAAQGTCALASQIGTATVSAGAGSEPYLFSGPVFLTGPYAGGPFGLSIAVPAVAGPFNFGTVVTRAAINVDPHTARVTTTSTLPTIVNGVPLRLKSISVAVNRPNFLYNPTSCAALATETTLTSTFGATQGLSSPFQATSCGALAFSPSFTASTNANTSKANGASLQVNLTQPAHQANIHSVVTSLPLALSTRLTTLQQACPEATYAANPFSCPAGSKVGSASATTPVLPGTLSGPAYLVSHGGAAFPDLDLILEGSGVRVVLEGNSVIRGGITTTTFASLPDVPVSSFSLTLPTGPNSVLAAASNLCAQPLLMPTTITAQNGARITQNTRIAVSGCSGSPVGAGEGEGEGFAGGRRYFKILRRRIVGHALLLKIQTFRAGTITARGKYLRSAKRKLGKAAVTTLRLPLTGGGLTALHHHRPLKVGVRIVMTPPRRGEPHASASLRVAFKH